jgi:hypothetical protein
MSEKDDKPPISLAAERKKFERDFSIERQDLSRELEAIGVATDQLAQFVQRTMEVEWAVCRAVAMLEYWGVDRDPQAVIRLVELIMGMSTASPKSR